MQVSSSTNSEKNIRIGAILALLVVALMAFIIWGSISRLVRDVGWVQHTMEVIESINKLDQDMTRRQTAEQIYQLTHNPAFLIEYQNFSADLRSRLNDFDSLTTDDSRRQNEVRVLTGFLDRSGSLPSSETDSQSSTRGLRSSAAVDDHALILSFVNQLNTMRDEEHSLLEIRRRQEQASIQGTYLLLTVLGLVFAGILGGTYVIGSRTLKARREALDESARLNVELEMTNLALELKRREADHANKLKSQFLASMSHELRTPLNAISGFSELLSDQAAGTLNEKQLRFLGHIRSASKHLLQLINDILDLSKIEAGEFKLEVTSQNAAAVVDQVAAGVESLLREKSLELQVSCDPHLTVRADVRRLTQILYNLLSNAIKFTPANGHIDIHVVPDGELLCFAVTDTGPGIACEDQKIIFEQFRQAAPSASGVKEGTGLGLAITKKLVERHGGRIEVESQPGAGSTFRFWLPSGTSSSVRTAISENAVPMRRFGEETPLILVVDDDANARELIRTVLEAAGYRVITADSSAQALQAARKLKPDLITLDLLMPGGNGFGTLYELRLLYEGAPPPVIIVSVVDDRAAGFALGAAEYLVKPVSKTDLLDVVRRHLPTVDAGLLVIDDDPAMLDLAREVFSQPWVRLYLAASGREGLKILESEAIDAVVLDLIMPEMDGFEFLDALRRRPQLANIPVSILTSKDLSREETEQLRKKANSIFSKNDDWKPGLVNQVAQSLFRARLEKEINA